MARDLALFVAGICVFLAGEVSQVEAATTLPLFLTAGDMLLNPGNFQSQIMASSAFKLYQTTPWPQGIVPVSFTSDVSPEQRKLFFAACAQWSQAAHVECIPRNTEPIFLAVGFESKVPQCQSTVGAAKGASMTLSVTCFTVPVLLHEIGHVLGLLHEHQRADRNKFVKVNIKNVKPEVRYAYDIISDSDITPIAYDFMSIMHYTRRAFALDPKKDVITPKSQYAAFGDLMGMQTELSPGDRAAVALIYGSR